MNLEALRRHLRHGLLVVLVGGALVVFPAALSVWGIRSLAQPWALLFPLGVWVVTLAVWWRVFRTLLPGLWNEGGAARSTTAGRGRRKRYLRIDTAHIDAYQRYFDELVATTDADNLLRVRNGEAHVSDTLVEDLERVDAAAARASAEGLDGDYVRIMFEQWVWADPSLRRVVRPSWVATVRRRRRNDFFPSARVVAQRRELWERCEPRVGCPAT